MVIFGGVHPSWTSRRQLHKVPNGLPPPRVNLVFARKPTTPSLLLKATPLSLLLARACLTFSTPSSLCERCFTPCATRVLPQQQLSTICCIAVLMLHIGRAASGGEEEMNRARICINHCRQQANALQLLQPLHWSASQCITAILFITHYTSVV